MLESESDQTQAPTAREQRAWYRAIKRLPPEDPSLNICARHRVTDLNREQFLSWPHDAELPADMHLGMVSEIKSRVAYCSLCALVVACATDMAILEEIPHHVDDVDIMSCWVRDGKLRCPHPEQSRSPSTSGQIDHSHVCSLQNCPGASTSLRLRIVFYDLGPNLYKGTWRDIVPLENDTKLPGSSDANLFCGRVVPRDQINGSLMRQWLTNCEKWHSRTCSSRGESEESNTNRFRARSIRLLDLEDSCLIEISDPRPYVCLSYVWGVTPVYKTLRRNLDDLKCLKSLDVLYPSLAKSIRDAIAVARVLGQRYIWIDSLCIVQDDDADKAQQISQMDQIYQHAELTIVVAGGDNADCGIDGLEPGSRSLETNTAVVSEDLTLMMLLPELSQAIAASTWNTRGWTYQEMLLSQRKLIFANGTLYFQCAGATWGEDYVAEHPDVLSCAPMQEINLTFGWEEPEVKPSLQYTLHTIPRPAEDTGSGSGLEPQSWFNEYVRTVTEYTSRKLRFESDRVAGFGAVLSNIAHTCDVTFVQGVPEEMFLEALLWQPKDRPIRMTERDPVTDMPLFPSWSWAGWMSGVGYDESTHDFENRGRSRLFAQMSFVQLGSSEDGSALRSRLVRIGEVKALSTIDEQQELVKLNAIRMRTRTAHFNLVVYDASGEDDPNG
ncbi:heterokaryon incompatibility protein-domain-containing protein [Nemania sp. FL0916]|nr:heterokaryon incompatibility protein-domain-containing protein [Nemania sp. FL0916]